MSTRGRRFITGQTHVAAVVGDPVAHSLSPVIHNAAFASEAMDWAYVALPLESGSSGEVIEALRGAWTLGLRGISVTMPHKAHAAEAAVERSALVEEIRVANTLVRSEDGWRAENTDVGGFRAFLTGDLGLGLSGSRCAIVGAGGAATAIAVALRDEGAAQVLVWNRTPGRSDAAVALAGSGGVAAGELTDLGGCDLVVGCVPAGAIDASAYAAIPFATDTTVVDLAYAPPHTPLMQAAEKAGASTHNGIGLLVNQAALQFELWTGRPAPIEVMSAAALAGM